MLFHLNERAPGEHLQLDSIDLEQLDVLEQLLEASKRSDVGDEVEPAEFGQLSQLPVAAFSLMQTSRSRVGSDTP